MTENSDIVKMEKETDEKTNDTAKNMKTNTRKVSEGENVEAIKQFIQDQEKEISDKKSSSQTEESVENSVDEIEPSGKEESKIDSVVEKPVENIGNVENETMAVASSVMDMILSESEARIAEKGGRRAMASECANSAYKG